MLTRIRAYQRSLAIGSVWVAAMVGLVATSPSASGQDGVQPGLGNAYAQGLKVDPRTGSLSIGLTYGMSLAGHQNNVATAEARSLDLGIIGTLLAGEGCDGGDPTLPKEQQPQPLASRSTDEGAGKPKHNTELGVDREVLATSEPLARAVATAGTLGNAALRVAGARTSTESGIIDGARVARAISEIGRVDIGGGALVLRGLRWEAAYQTVPEEHTTGSFTIDGIEVAGQRVPIPAGDAVEALSQANQLLEPLGLRITPPTVRKEGGIQFVDSLRIAVVPSKTRESILGPVFNAIQPVRENLVQAILDMDCGNATYVTVLDIVLGTVSGAGSLGVELGGVRASSGDIKLTSFLGGLGGGGLGPVPAPSTDGGSLTAGGSSTGSFDPSSTGPLDTGTADTATDTGGDQADGGGDEEAALPPVRRASGSRGGPLAWVGLGGLLLLAALAEGDRRKMRRAQRSIPMEVMA